MATYRERCGKWRAEVKRCGVATSRTFPTLDDAREWAAGVEAEILAQNPPARPAPRRVVPLSRRVPQEIVLPDGFAPLAADAIVAIAKPLHEASGVYFLIHAGAIVYVGQSLNVHARVLDHVGRVEFDAYAVIPCPADRMGAIESVYIAELRPKHNRRISYTPIGYARAAD